MSDLSLRAYHRKIESWIEENEVDRAISQTAFLIGEFPKDLQSWRCLSKALLQKQDFDNADQVFDIILRVDPDDFVAHIGKSMAAESRNELDEAVEHMRRAFEIQPSNEGLQNELKRLIQKKDGIEPQKIHLTRGALIKMYMRGQLFEQAIAEALIGVRENPKRMDFHLALAESYEKTGDYAKAVETCINIVCELPYCQKANEILHGILAKSSAEDVPQIYLKRLIAVDPYYAYVTETTSSVLDVPDIAVLLEDHSDDEPVPVNIETLINQSWESENEPNKEFQASDWQKIIDKALGTSQKEMEFAIGDCEEVSDAEMNKPAVEEEIPQPHSRKEAFLERLRSTSQKEKSSIPEWIFDQDGELVHQAFEEEAEPIQEEVDVIQIPVSEPKLEEQEEAEPHIEHDVESEWISETERNGSEEKNEIPGKLEDTQEIKIPDYEPAYMLDIAEKAVMGENYHYALATFRKLINQGDHIEDVIHRLEKIIQDHPENSELLLFLGELYTRQGKREEALRVYRQAQKIIAL